MPTVFETTPAAPPAGWGDHSLNHNGGAGVVVDGVVASTDCLRYVQPTGDGAAGLIIIAYVAADFDASPRVLTEKGRTTTASDGRWTVPLRLAAGTYYVIAGDPGDHYRTQKNTVIIV